MTSLSWQRSKSWLLGPHYQWSKVKDFIFAINLLTMLQHHITSAVDWCTSGDYEKFWASIFSISPTRPRHLCFRITAFQMRKRKLPAKKKARCLLRQALKREKARKGATSLSRMHPLPHHQSTHCFNSRPTRRRSPKWKVCPSKPSTRTSPRVPPRAWRASSSRDGTLLPETETYWVGPLLCL